MSARASSVSVRDARRSTANGGNKDVGGEGMSPLCTSASLESYNRVLRQKYEMGPHLEKGIHGCLFAFAF